MPLPRYRKFTAGVFQFEPPCGVIGLATFISLIVWVYLHSYLCSGLQKTHLFCNRVRFGPSRSSKVDDFGNNRKRVCDFLFLPHCDYGPIKGKKGKGCRFVECIVVNAVGRRSSRRSGGATSNALSSRARSRWPHRQLPTACTHRPGQRPDRWPDSASPQ